MTDIPIQNIYYLLCYVWDHAERRGAIEVGDLDPPQVGDLFARLLTGAVNDIIRRGLDRDYVEYAETLPLIRGKLDFGESLRRALLPTGHAHCQFDELSVDVPPNQVIKAALRSLHRSGELSRENQVAVSDAARRMAGVSTPRHARTVARRLRMHSNNRHYDFAVRVARLVLDQRMPDEAGTGARFADFARERLPDLFERFVRRFYQRHARGYRVGALRFPWHDVKGDQAALDALPQLKTDVTLQSRRRTIVVDTKFYQTPLLSSRWSERLRVRPDHLNQLYAYVRNLQLDPRTQGTEVEGALLYARTDRDFDLEWEVHGVRLRARSVNLGRPWREIEDGLLAVLDRSPTQFRQLRL